MRLKKILLGLLLFGTPALASYLDPPFHIEYGGTGITALAHGSIIYGPASGQAASTLAIGSTGNVLTVSGGVPTWAAPAAASISIGSTITSGTANSILYVDATPSLAQDNTNFSWTDSTLTQVIGANRLSLIGANTTDPGGSTVGSAITHNTLNTALGIFTINSASSTRTGSVRVFTGKNTSSGGTGSLIVQSGDSASADSGAITIKTGTAGTTRGKINLDALNVLITNFSSAGVVHNDSSGNLTTSNVVNADVDSAAAIAYSKLASMSTGQVLLGNAGTPTATSLSGGATVGATGTVTLGNPGASTLGGIESLAATSHNWINAISTSGVPSATQPAFSDISGTASATQGGTAQSTYTTGDTLYASASNTLSKLAIGGTGTVLTVSGGVPTWASPASSTFYAPNTQVFLSGTSYGVSYWFTVTSANATAGAVYTNNGHNFTVVNTISSGTTLLCTSNGAPSGTTLTKSTGTGDSTITFSASKAPLYIEVIAVGGGGGGGGSGNGGTGGSGGDTTFSSSSVIKAGGASGAPNGNNGVGGAGGPSAIGSPAIEVVAQDGGTGMSLTNEPLASSIALGGTGGVSPFGGAGQGGVGSGSGQTGGAAVNHSGSGGGGAGSSNGAGGEAAGGGGAGAYVDAIIQNPAATYTIAIGGGGAGGTAGSSGSPNAAGGAGGAGRLTVKEFFQ